MYLFILRVFVHLFIYAFDYAAKKLCKCFQHNSHVINSVFSRSVGGEMILHNLEKCLLGLVLCFIEWSLIGILIRGLY